MHQLTSQSEHRDASTWIHLHFRIPLLYTVKPGDVQTGGEVVFSQAKENTQCGNPDKTDLSSSLDGGVEGSLQRQAG